MIDGGLRKLFHLHLRHFDWQAIETGGVGKGIPDSNYCCKGIEGWVEFKRTETWVVGLSPQQIGWHMRRSRAGGRTFIAVRRKYAGGPRKGIPVDQLLLYPGALAQTLMAGGFDQGGHALCFCQKGPAKWDWGQIEDILMRPML